MNAHLLIASGGAGLSAYRFWPLLKTAGYWLGTAALFTVILFAFTVDVLIFGNRDTQID